MKITKKEMKEAAIAQVLREQLTYENPHLGPVLCHALPDGKNTLELIIQKVRFVEEVLAGDGPGVKFLRTPSAYRQADITALGVAWYALAQRDTTFMLDTHFAFGEAIKLFDEVSKTLELTTGRYKRNPLEQIHPRGPIEGEYLNGFIEMLRARGRAQDYQTKVAKRQQAIKEQLQPLRAFVKRFPTSYNTLFGHWCHLTYRFDTPEVKAVTQRQATKFMQRFQEELAQNIARVPSVGQLWFPQYLPEIGYTFRILFIFVPYSPASDDECTKAILACWDEATESIGHIELGREVTSKLAILDEIKHFAAASEMLSLPLKKAYPLGGFVDTHLKAETVLGVQAHKFDFGEIFDRSLNQLKQGPHLPSYAKPEAPIVVSVISE